MNEAILIVVYNRPQYLKEVLDSISKAYNIENFDIFFNIDYDAKSFYRNMLLIRKFLRKTNKQFFKNNIQINKPALGCGANHKHGLTRVFSQGYKNIVCIEDDIIVAPDIFVLFNQVRKEYNPFILNLFGCTEYDEKNKLNKLF
jgi:GT2 family glycosyltransferase